jgi:hypothetical protein
MALSNLTTFNFVQEFAQFVVDAVKYVFTNMATRQATWLVKDLTGSADGDFTNRFEFELNSMPTMGYLGCWGWSESLEGEMNYVLRNDKLLQCRLGRNSGGAYYLQLLEWDNAVLLNIVLNSGVSLGVHYFIEFIRDESIGSFGRLTLLAWTVDFGDTLAFTIPIDLNEKVDYTKAYALQCDDVVPPTSPPANGFCQNYDFGEVVSDTVIPPPLLQGRVQ